jgi:hypothetical protein
VGTFEQPPHSAASPVRPPHRGRIELAGAVVVGLVVGYLLPHPGKSQPPAAPPSSTRSVPLAAAQIPDPAPKTVEVKEPADPAAAPSPTVSASQPPVVVEVPKARPASPAASSPVAAAAAPDYRLLVQLVKFNTEPVDSIGSIWFTGEVYNAAPKPLRIKILVKAIGERTIVLSSQETYVEPNPVPSLGRAVFRSYVESRGADVVHVTAEPIVVSW